MKPNTNKLLMLMATAAFMMGCSVQGEITDLTQKTIKLKAGNATGFLSTSKQAEVTGGGYKVFSSAGHATSGIYQQVGGYKVYTTLQGNNSSESAVETIE